MEGAGHYGIFSGRRWRDIVYPQVRDFITRFEKERVGSAAAKKAVRAKPAPAPAKKTRAPARKTAKVTA